MRALDAAISIASKFGSLVTALYVVHIPFGENLYPRHVWYKEFIDDINKETHVWFEDIRKRGKENANSKAIVIVDQSVYGNLYGHNTNLAWVNGATLLVEHICQGNGYYGQEILYNGNTYGHYTNVPCTTIQVRNDPINNSVWFENGNTLAKPPGGSSGWAQYITSTVTANNAYEAKNSVNGWVLWTNSYNTDADCSGTWSSQVMTGDLKSGHTANWSYLTNMPSRRTC
jgi:hypothetical protein